MAAANPKLPNGLKMAQNDSNGPKWPRKPKWPEVVTNGTNGVTFARIAELVQTGPEQSKWPKITQDGVPNISSRKFRKDIFGGDAVYK